MTAVMKPVVAMRCILLGRRWELLEWMSRLPSSAGVDGKLPGALPAPPSLSARHRVLAVFVTPCQPLFPSALARRQTLWVVDSLHSRVAAAVVPCLCGVLSRLSCLALCRLAFGLCQLRNARLY